MTITDLNASAVDTPSIQGQIALTDSGALVDIPDLTISLPIADSGAGLEAVSPEITFTITEAGAGAEFVEILGSQDILVTDDGSFSEIFNLETAVAIIESGVGAEIIDLTVSFTAADETAALDSIILDVSMTVTDMVTGADLWDLEGSFTVADEVVGDDLWSLSYTAEITDTGAGVDAWNLEFTLSAGDVGSGADVVDLQAASLVEDEAAGVDIIISISLTLEDLAQGVDEWSYPSVTLTVSEAAAGSEAAQVDVDFTVTDTGTLSTETLTIQGQIGIYDSGALVVEVAWIAFTVTDSCAGADVITLNVQLLLSDSLSGADVWTVNFGYPIITDSGVGVDNYWPTFLPFASEEALGAEIIWKQKGETLIDDLELPHVQRIQVTDEARVHSAKRQGILPDREMRGLYGRTVQVEGWTDSQNEIESLKALVDGQTRTFTHPGGLFFTALVTNCTVIRDIERYDRRRYVLTLLETRA
jgi:hypothetical protein